ncbi:hypothetical protein EDC01DRAFT_645013 [Geopyxis carbonaria]|nr:hypothetical protein EDC01DRAFT_645013 [Geopyxis carbonaria]
MQPTSFLFLLSASLGLVAASPLQSAPPVPARKPLSSFKDGPPFGQDDRAYTPGAKISPAWCTQPGKYDSNICPAHLPSNNVLVTSVQQQIYESEPDSDKTSTTPGGSYGWNKHPTKKLATEVRTLAIFENFNADGAFDGKKCRFHFISDLGRNWAGPNETFAVYAVDSPYEAAKADMATTWHSKPRHSRKVGSWIADDVAAENVSGMVVDGKPSKSKLSMPWTNEKDRVCDCPKKGTYVWVIGPDRGPEFKRMDYDHLVKTFSVGDSFMGDVSFLGGHNGLAIEVMDSSELSGWGQK